MGGGRKEDKKQDSQGGRSSNQSKPIYTQAGKKEGHCESILPPKPKAVPWPWNELHSSRDWGFAVLHIIFYTVLWQKKSQLAVFR